MDNDTFGAPVPGTTPQPTPNPVPTPQQEPIAPAEPSAVPVTESAAPVATPADPGAPVIAATPEPSDNPFEKPANAPFEQPTAAVPADLAAATPAPEPAPAQEPASAPESATTPVSEAAPAASPVTASAAPVASPADPGAPTAVPTTIGDNHVPASDKKKTTMIIGIIAGVVVLVAVALILTFFVFGRKTLSCTQEDSLTGAKYNETIEASFLFDEITDAKSHGSITADNEITDDQIEILRDSLNKQDDYTNTKLERSGSNSVTFSAEVKKSVFKGDKTTYDEAKKTLESRGFVCK